MKKFRIFAILLAGLLTLTLSACASPANQAAQPTPQAVSAAVGDNPLYIIAEGVVLPAHKAALSFANSGVVKEIFFTEGDSLKSGDIIASLSGVEQLNASLANAEYVVLDTQQALDTFLEQDAINRANAEVALAKARLELEDAQDERKNKDLQPASQLTLDGLKADFVLALDQLNDQEDEYRTYKENRDEEDPIRALALKDLVAARKDYEKAATNLNYALGFPNADDVEAADSRVNLAQAEVEKAQADYDALKDGPDPDQLEVLQASLRAAEAQLASAQRNLDDLFFSAPFNSTLVSSNLEVGEFVTPGDGVVQIGTLDQWVIESTDLTELDIVSIKVGDPVKIKFDALPNVEISGTVQNIKMLGVEQQGNITYKVTILPDEMLAALHWNMTAFMMFEKE